MKLGLIGPLAAATSDASECLNAALSVLVDQRGATEVVYLGDGQVVDEAVAREAERMAEVLGCGDFTDRAAILAADGTADEIRHLLEADQRSTRFSRLKIVPGSPARAVEMIGDRLLILVHDKSVLDEDDVASASIVAFGESKAPVIRRIGPRIFLSPGVLSEDEARLGMIEDSVGSSGQPQIALRLYDLDGSVQKEEVLKGVGAVVQVSN